MTLLEEEFTRHHDVEFYATQLEIAPVKLSKILNRVVGKSTKQLIDERISLEAKRFLSYTDRPIKEIAADLGYSDLFHFSKTFKRLASVSPQAFREQREKPTYD
jgi:AraC family transcriptional activator of pobA